MRVRVTTTLACLIVIMGVAHASSATQILVGPGSRWADLAEKARPGDEIILMPGIHRAVVLNDLTGTEEQPIIIRSLSPDRMVTIKAENYGIRLNRPRHVILQDLIIDGATINGILIDCAPDKFNKDAPHQPEQVGNVELRNIEVTHTGPKGQRHAIELIGVFNTTITECNIVGWGGSGIELVKCSGITISKTTFLGLEHFSQVNGIRIRAGSNNVDIFECKFSNPGLSGVCVGGSSKFKDFEPSVAQDAQKASVFEARHVSIEKNIFDGGSAAIILTHSDRTQINRNTIYNPEHYIICMIDTNELNILGSCRRITIGQNIIIWKQGTLQKYFLIDKNVDRKTLKIQQNLWWSEESAEARMRLGEIPHDPRAKQLYDVDPQLNEKFYPTNLAANGYGANPLKIARPGDENR